MGSCGDEEATVEGQSQEATVQPGECARGGAASETCSRGHTLQMPLTQRSRLAWPW